MKYIYVKNIYFMEPKLSKLWWMLKIQYCFRHFINLFTNLLISSKYLFNEIHISLSNASIKFLFSHESIVLSHQLGLCSTKYFFF